MSTLKKGFILKLSDEWLDRNNLHIGTGLADNIWPYHIADNVYLPGAIYWRDEQRDLNYIKIVYSDLPDEFSVPELGEYRHVTYEQAKEALALIGIKL